EDVVRESSLGQLAAEDGKPRGAGHLDCPIVDLGPYPVPSQLAEAEEQLAAAAAHVEQSRPGRGQSQEDRRGRHLLSAAGAEDGRGGEPAVPRRADALRVTEPGPQVAATHRLDEPPGAARACVSEVDTVSLGEILPERDGVHPQEAAGRVRTL